MKIVIVGCGKIGKSVLKSLVQEGHDITAVDADPDIVSEITNTYDVMGVCGNSVDSETLEEAGVEKTDLFVAMTGSDEYNMLSCFLAKKLGASNTIARIRNPEYNDSSLAFLKHNLEISMAINPELLAAKEMYNMLKLPQSVKVENFSRRNLEMIELRVTPEMNLDGLMVMKLREKIKAEFLICAVQREDNLFVPDGHFVLHDNDKIGLISSPNEVLKLFKILGIENKRAKNVMILGGSKTAYYLGKLITNVGNSVKIIEKDEARCESLSTSLPRAIVIHGDGSQQELLLEEGISNIDAFVALTGMDEQNILICTYASMNNVPKVITKINREELAYMAEKIGLESLVSTKEITSNILVSYARALQNSLGSNVETLYKVMDGMAEALEFNVSAESKVINIPLKDLSLKPNILIAGITRGKKTILPSGYDVIMQGDRVIVLAANQRLQDLDDILDKQR